MKIPLAKKKPIKEGLFAEISLIETGFAKKKAALGKERTALFLSHPSPGNRGKRKENVLGYFDHVIVICEDASAQVPLTLVAVIGPAPLTSRVTLPPVIISKVPSALNGTPVSVETTL
jgi:hypothetical protein